jgi:hypothetical protein
MPGRSFEIRYPNGDFEIDAAPYPPPAVGDAIRRKGQLWRVTARTEGKPVVVRVELAEAGSKHISR